MNEIAVIQQRGILTEVAHKYGFDPDEFQAVVLRTCMPDKGNDVTKEQFYAFLAIAREYNLNPLTREIFAFKAKGGGIQTVIPVDGWLTLINRHPEFDGMITEEIIDESGQFEGVTCTIHRKDRKFPTVVTEYYQECRRDAEPWKIWPRRMTRHKSIIQCARVAFGIGAGAHEPDEAERFNEMRDVTPEPVKPEPKKAKPRDMATFASDAEQRRAEKAGRDGPPPDGPDREIEGERIDPETGEVTDTTPEPQGSPRASASVEPSEVPAEPEKPASEPRSKAEGAEPTAEELQQAFREGVAARKKHVPFKATPGQYRKDARGEEWKRGWQTEDRAWHSGSSGS